MEQIVQGVRLVLLRGSIVDQDTDAIVNAANTAMRGGGGVDGAIHSAAGPDLLEELKRVAPNGAETGEVVVTPGYNLRAKYVLHVAGPVWSGGDKNEATQLAACYSNAIRRAEELGSSSVAFPSISTGVYGYPIGRAAPIALGRALHAVKDGTSIKEFRFVAFSDEDYAVYADLFERWDEIHPSLVEFRQAGFVP